MLNSIRRSAGLCFGIVIAVSLAHAATTTAPATIQGFHTTYELRYMGLRANATIDLKPAEAPHEYLYTVTTKTRGLASLIRPGTATEVARFVYDENGFRPLTYHLDDGVAKAENDSDIWFDWTKNIAHCVHETATADLAIRPGMLDRLTADIAVIQELRNGRQPTGFDLVDRNAIRRFDYILQGEETIKVPAGTFKTLKYLRNRPGSSRATLIWFAPEKEYLPVKITQLKRGKAVVEMLATRLEPAAAAANTER